MARVFTIDDSEDDREDIRVFIPGPPGPNGSIIDVGSRSEPTLITNSIAAQIYPRQRSFIQGASGPVVDPAIPDGQGTYELCLFCTSNSNTVTLNSSANIQLSGQWVGVSGSIISLIWDGASMYVEDYRNEI